MINDISDVASTMTDDCIEMFSGSFDTYRDTGVINDEAVNKFFHIFGIPDTANLVMTAVEYLQFIGVILTEKEGRLRANLKLRGLVA